MSSQSIRSVLGVVMLVALPITGAAQAVDPAPMHDHAAMQAQTWHLMQDGAIYLNANHQGGPRGGSELVSQNWWMGMGQRPLWRGTLTLSLMLSLEPATAGRDGYREIFQVGEALDDLPLVDRQHPHDFLMQAAAVWRVPLARGYALTLAGAPVGEPSLGPVAFMHRASAADNPTAPLGHHTFDSTHIAMGVLAAGLDKGPWQVESSIFRGREPDGQRWDLMDPGALDSWAVRGWYRPSPSWAFQISHGFLTDPEELESGDVRRTTVSAAWTRSHGSRVLATTVAYGRNNKVGADFGAFLAESTYRIGKHAVYGRVEATQVESDLLRFGVHAFLGGKKAHVPEDAGRVDLVKALTIGGTRTIGARAGWDLSAGADLTLYGVPEVLAPTHGDRPVSFHVFLRLRPPAPAGRMTDVTMTRMMR